eukprot:GHVN01089438.1.p1 GENE.GHVN01089438.1~~GHVN01089438.1.p1  ORF type:complete len:1297 (+),score=182.15 GHVN01089438.1:900-4790(+)
MSGFVCEMEIKTKQIEEKDVPGEKWADVLVFCAERGYLSAELREREDEACTVEYKDGRRETVACSRVFERNPKCFHTADDTSEMPHLTEATVFESICQRYHQALPYTYSGLFLVAVNPYRELSIYTARHIEEYSLAQKTQRPHIFALADRAYKKLLLENKSQSILITGESGAGKTENTKRAIQYISAVAGTALGKMLDKQIVLSGQILEAFGNAQTARNNNSSRFGKYIRIEFENGRIAGAAIEKYLFEKSRVTTQQAGERTFHVFYQLLAGASDSEKERLLLRNDEHYKYALRDAISDSDQAAFDALRRDMDSFGLGADEVFKYFSVVAAVLHLGNIGLHEDRDGKAAVSNEALKNACLLLGISPGDFSAALLHPTLQAGRETVVVEQTVAQAQKTLEAFARTLYERMFDRLVQHINSVIDCSSEGGNTLGILDIAGFEIIENNLLEQLCINHTNERLQQFFNHEMFIREQEEYRKEGLKWDQLDFGLDSQPIIDLIERLSPPGILALLDEECVMPAATDETFLRKLETHLGGEMYFSVSRFRDSFSLSHYAGRVVYRIESWLEKNKDPVNTCLVRCVASSATPFISALFDDTAGHLPETKHLKKGIFRTCAQKHKESLILLCEGLQRTTPHFVRCIVPNSEKTPGKIDAPLVLSQIRCNGVLEGIRIYRQGYPNKLFFSDFRRRYFCLSPAIETRDPAEWVRAFLQDTPGDLFRLGRERVFFRANVLGVLEERRKTLMNSVLLSLGRHIRLRLAKLFARRRERASLFVECLQGGIRRRLQRSESIWWNVYSQTLPFTVLLKENESRALKEDIADLKEKIALLDGETREHQDRASKSLQENKRMQRETSGLLMQLREASEKKDALLLQKLERETVIIDLEEKTAALGRKLQRKDDEEKKINAALEKHFGEFDDIVSEVVRVHEEKAALEDRVVRLVASLAEQKDGVGVEELAQLKERHRSEMERLKQEAIDEAQSLRKEMSLLRERSKKEVSMLNAEVALARRQMAEYKETEKSNMVSELKTRLMLEAERRIDEENKTKEAMECAERLRAEIQQLLQEVEMLKGLVKALKEKENETAGSMSCLQKECEGLRTQLEEAAIIEVGRREEVEEEHTRRRLLQTQAECLSRELQETKDAMLVYKEKHQTAETLYRCLQTVNRELEESLNEALSEKETLESEAKELQKRVFELEISEPRKRETRLSSSAKEIDEVVLQIEQESNERHRLQQETRRLERCLASEQAASCSLKEKLQLRSLDVAELRQTAKKNTEMLCSLETTICEREKEIKMLRHRLDAAK